MKFIGITGSYSSGKSYILRFLESLNYKIFSADEYLRILYKDKNIQKEMMKIFPEMKISDKTYIAKNIYSNDEYRRSLENFVHPKVHAELKSFAKENTAERMLIAEVPLLSEAGFERYFDHIITIFCDDNIRLDRSKSRPGFSQEKFDKLSQLQLPQSEKIKKSDVAFDTAMPSDKLKSEIINFLQSLE